MIAYLAVKKRNPKRAIAKEKPLQQILEGSSSVVSKLMFAHMFTLHCSNLKHVFIFYNSSEKWNDFFDNAYVLDVRARLWECSAPTLVTFWE